MNSILRLDQNILVGKDFKIFSSKAVSDLGLHRHSYCELIYFYDGILESTVNGQKVKLRKGTVYMMSPLDLHHTVVTDKTAPIHFVNVSFNENAVDNKISPKLNCPYYIQNSGNRIKTLFDLIMSSDNDIEKSHILNVILSNVVNDKNRLENMGAKTTINPSVVACIKYIADNFNNDVSLNSTAKYLHLAPAYLSNLFSKSCGCTFTEYLTSFRLSHAKSLLKSTDLTVNEICFMCGFSNLAHFFRCFKNKFRSTPAQYRKSVDG